LKRLMVGLKDLGYHLLSLAEFEQLLDAGTAHRNGSAKLVVSPYCRQGCRITSSATV
jgi:hypothetical protein